MTPNDLRALLKQGDLSGARAARICGVNPRTIRRWIGGDSAIPWSAWTLLQQVVASMECEAEDDAIENAAPMLPNEQIAVLRGIEQEQERAIQRLEVALTEARNDLAQTRQRIHELAP